MSRFSRRLLAGLLAASLAMFMVIAINVNSANAAGCYANSCTGQDPIAEGCSADAVTLDSVTSGFTVQLRYSHNCYAVWAKAIGTTDSQWAGEILGYTNKTDPYPVVGYVTGTPSPQGSYSRMVSFTYWTQACIAYNAYGWETHQCTALH